ncbi:hypothetical protein DXG03_006748 [Asterophora parasitica]|uniref:Uncharacterized protein n=1 Tax=Asterophora parasitica TaxID=117018 RepID=A0A9P7G102_9AGAR|nr:hypothetical protein DXG03_006748 [Asterophora parasitica]
MAELRKYSLGNFHKDLRLSEVDSASDSSDGSMTTEEDMEPVELVFVFIGGSDKMESTEHVLECDIPVVESRVVKPIPEPWEDSDFVSAATKAFRKMENTLAFWAAGVTITPRWFNSLNIKVW